MAFPCCSPVGLRTHGAAVPVEGGSGFDDDGVAQVALVGKSWIFLNGGSPEGKRVPIAAVAPPDDAQGALVPPNGPDTVD